MPERHNFTSVTESLIVSAILVRYVFNLGGEPLLIFQKLTPFPLRATDCHRDAIAICWRISELCIFLYRPCVFYTAIFFTRVYTSRNV